MPKRQILLLYHTACQDVALGIYLLEQILEGFHEQRHAIELKLFRHLVDVHTHFGQLIHRLLCAIQIIGQCVRRLCHDP